MLTGCCFTAVAVGTWVGEGRGVNVGVSVRVEVEVAVAVTKLLEAADGAVSPFTISRLEITSSTKAAEMPATVQRWCLRACRYTFRWANVFVMESIAGRIVIRTTG